MWSASISQSQSTLYSAEDIRRFLAPQDSVTQALMEGRLSSRHRPAEFTCEWATKRVSDIARGKNGLTILTGKEYCGKSVLANWIAERMTNNRGRIRHDVLMFEVDSALKENSSDIAIAKALVLQVFDKLIGNQALYRDVCGAIKAELAGKPQEQVVDLLWLSIHNSISSLEKTMIIVDGTDGLETKQQTRLLQRLSELSGSHPLVKAIAVSRPLGSAPPKGSTIWSIETQDIHNDIVSFAYERLSENSMLGSLQPSQLQSLAERLATASNGSFAWADIAIEVVSHEQTISAVSKSIDGLPKDLKGLIDRLITTVSLQDRDSRAILAWMLAAQRPLLLGEVKALLEIDCSSVQITERFSDIENDVRRSCGGLISITDGLLRFKTLAIRHHLVSLAGSVKDFSNSSKNVFPFNMQEASYDLCIRSLAYVKLTLDRQYPYSQEPLTYNQLTEVFGELPFMEYACRYWLSHFRSSPMHQHPGTHKLTSTFKAVMPDSVPHTRLEYTCLRSQYSIQETCDLLQLSLSLRTLVFTEQAPSVLQTLINVALTIEKIKPDEANQYYHRCFKVGRELVADESTLIIWVAHRYIDTLKTMTKSTELEEILTYVIRIYKRDYGTSHDSTLIYMRRLAEYYVITKETTKAFTVYKEIYEVMVSKYGYHATETQTIFTSLQKISTKEQLQSITQEQHVSAERTLDVSDTKRVVSTQEQIQQYEKENNVQKAEETMVNYWRDISEKSRTSKDVKVQEQQIDATFEYVKFLQRQKRTEEATTILNGLYLELDKSTNYNESKITWIQRIGNEMKTMGSTSSARGVFSYLWSYYRSTGQHTSKEAQTIARSLTETTTSTTTTTKSTEEQITFYREMLETNMMTTQTMDETTIRIAIQLITSYSRTESHEDIIEVCREVLQRHWPAVLVGNQDTRFPQTFTNESIEIANHLATSYMRLNFVDEASQIRYGIFTAYRTQPDKNVEKLITYGRELIQHYQSIYRSNDVLIVYQQLYEALTKVYGATHKETISILYEKAAFERKHNRKTAAQQSYTKIYTTLKGDSNLCPREAIPAAQTLAQIYEKEQNWEAARSIYSVLWQTFLQKGQEYALGMEFVNQIFDRYLYILEEKSQTDYNTRRGLASEYRQTYQKFYGAESERTINASMKLATLDEKDEKHRSEAISIYESILSMYQQNKISGASISIVVGNTRRRLAHLYSVMGITSEQAQTLYLEEFDSARSTHGTSHADVLMWLGLLIACYNKRNNEADTRKAVERLQTTATDIMLHETDSQKLYESSQSIAKIYQQNQLSNPTASEYASELRRHAVRGESNIASLKGKSVPRRVYTFIVGTEETINGGQFSVIMSELMTETLLTEAFLNARTKDASFDVIFHAGKRLRQFLISRKRTESSQVDADLLEVFKRKVVMTGGTKQQPDQAAVRQYFDIVINRLDEDSHDLAVLRIATEAIGRAFKESQFQRAYWLAFIVDRYAHFNDGYRSQSKIELAFQVCMMLNGRAAGVKSVDDKTLQGQMNTLSASILTEALSAAKSIQLNFVALPIETLNILIVILGQQKNYADLEWILSDLWNARHQSRTTGAAGSSQGKWTTHTTVTIGRRLVECRYMMNESRSALDLLEDICYNLRRVWGPLDNTTLSMESLRAAMYTSLGQNGEAMGVHEEILSHLTSDEIDLDNVSAEKEASIAVAEMQAMRTSFLRNGARWPKNKDEGFYDELYHVVSEQVGKEKAWKDAKIEDVNKWSAAAKSFKDDGSGGYKGAEIRWEIIEDDSQKGAVHINALRKRSTRFSGEWGMLNGNSNGHSNGYTNGSVSSNGNAGGSSSYSVTVSTRSG